MTVNILVYLHSFSLFQRKHKEVNRLPSSHAVLRNIINQRYLCHDDSKMNSNIIISRGSTCHLWWRIILVDIMRLKNGLKKLAQFRFQSVYFILIAGCHPLLYLLKKQWQKDK